MDYNYSISISFVHIKYISFGIFLNIIISYFTHPFLFFSQSTVSFVVFVNVTGLLHKNLNYSNTVGTLQRFQFHVCGHSCVLVSFLCVTPVDNVILFFTVGLTQVMVLLSTIFTFSKQIYYVFTSHCLVKWLIIQLPFHIVN